MTCQVLYLFASQTMQKSSTIWTCLHTSHRSVISALLKHKQYSYLHDIALGHLSHVKSLKNSAILCMKTVVTQPARFASSIFGCSDKRASVQRSGDKTR